MGEIVTPQDKSKLFSVMKTRKIASLLKIYGPQIIPKRQRAFPTKAFLLIQAAHLFKQAEEPAAATWLRSGCRPRVSACGVRSLGPRGSPVFSKRSPDFLSLCISALWQQGKTAGEDSLFLPPNQQVSLSPSSPDMGGGNCPHSSLLQTTFTLEGERPDMPTLKGNFQAS